MVLGMNRSVCLITGGASGLGFEFARLARADGYDLVLVDLCPKLLKEAKAALGKTGYGRIDLLTFDLSSPNAGQRLYQDIKSRSIDLLINNAGFGLFGNFSETSWKREEKMLFLHIMTITQLTKLILRDMIARDRGRIMIVSSMAAFQPGPLMAVYYASKSYLLSLAEALSEEVRNSKVHVMAFCPGPTLTDFQKTVSAASSQNRLSFNMADKTSVARYGYRALFGKRTVVIPGSFNRFLALLPRILPRELVAHLVWKIQIKNRPQCQQREVNISKNQLHSQPARQ
jgi:short-subunit dehydrogenase